MSIGPIPHPIPYQGSKRLLAPVILRQFPDAVDRLLEPFAGSAAVSLAAAAHRRAKRFVLNDVLEPLAALWQMVLSKPDTLADRYEELWRAQEGREREFYDSVRDDYNRSGDPAALLYLLARCVKNSVRFNRAGQFNQSPDNRRLGMRPATMRANIRGASGLLAGRTEVRSGDYAPVLGDAGPGDVVYMDPPYLGTSTGRDNRYIQPLDLSRFAGEVSSAGSRGVHCIVSLDGRTGEKCHGPDLSDELGLFRLEVEVGPSTQATLIGRREMTVESLYVPRELGGSERILGVRPKTVSMFAEV